MVSVRCHARRWGACAAFGIALVFGGCASVVGQPQPSPATYQSKQAGHNAPQPLPPSPGTIKTRPLYVDAYCDHGCGYSEDKSGFWQRLITDPNAFFAGVIAFLTLGLIVTGVMQWRSMRGQERALRRSIIEMRRASNKQSRDTRAMISQGNTSIVETRNGERAWVTLGQPDISMTHNEQGRFFSVNLTWRNFGRTPALRCSISTGGDRYPRPDPAPPTSVIGPGGAVRSDTIHFPAMPAFLRRPFSMRSKLSYFDIFDNIERHSEVILEFRYWGNINPMTSELNDLDALAQIVHSVAVTTLSHTAD